MCQRTQVSLGLEGALTTGGMVGLPNIRNTSYMNTILQCLSHTVEMTQIYLHSDSLAEIETPLSRGGCRHDP